MVDSVLEKLGAARKVQKLVINERIGTALQEGVRDVVAKPFKIHELKDLIQRVADEISLPLQP